MSHSPSRRFRHRIGALGLPLLAGFGIVLAGWDLVGHLRRESVSQLVFGAGSGPAHPAPGPEWTAVLVFTPAECPGLMTVVDRLNQISSIRLKVQGLLVVDPRRFPGWRDLITANAIVFPVGLADPARAQRALETAGDLRTPVMLLFDRRNELRLTSNLADRPELVSLISNAVAEDKRP